MRMKAFILIALLYAASISNALASELETRPISHSERFPIFVFPPLSPNFYVLEKDCNYVKIEFDVNADGEIIDSRIIESDPPGQYDEAALQMLQAGTRKIYQGDSKKPEVS